MLQQNWSVNTFCNKYMTKEFLGAFVKLVLKINNIAKEMINVCEQTENICLKHRLSQIAELTLKYVVTNQSLYV